MLIMTSYDGVYENPMTDIVQLIPVVNNQTWRLISSVEQFNCTVHAVNDVCVIS
jgi:hypothetical protein